MYSLAFVPDTWSRPVLIRSYIGEAAPRMIMMIRSKQILLVIISGLLFISCTVPVRPTVQAKYKIDLNRAKSLISDGKYQDAAQIYTAIASKTTPPDQDLYRLLAAEALSKGADMESARKMADKINPNHLSPQNKARWRLLYGRFYLDENKPEETLHQLESIRANTLNPNLKREYYAQQAEVFSLIGNHLESARSYIEIGNFPHQPDELEKNNSAIFDQLSQLSPQTLARLRPTSPQILNGWMGLTLIFKQTERNSPEFKRQIELWKKQYPNHPGNSFLQGAKKTTPLGVNQKPVAIGILLPQSGPFAQASEAIKEGILIAQSYNNLDAPKLKFYDTASQAPYTLYQKAIEDGCNIIIGPLNKLNLKSLAEGGELSVPVLALNQLPNVAFTNLFQFGLNPEDEADQAAESAWSDGLRQALILAPASNFGDRIASHFSNYWQQLGGTVGGMQSYNTNTMDYSRPINNLLRKISSTREVHSKYGSASAHSPSFVFLIALPQQARQIWPQLQYYGATDIPVYATSQIYGGRENPYLDQDLSGITFCDIPWLFNISDGENPSLEKVASSRQRPLNNYVRFIALGFDAYNLLPKLSALQSTNTEYKGVTGVLSLTQNNRFHRSLQCAKFEEGRPILRGAVPSPNEDYMDNSRPTGSSGIRFVYR